MANTRDHAEEKTRWVCSWFAMSGTLLSILPSLAGCTTSVEGGASGRAFPGPVLLGPVTVVGGGNSPKPQGEHALAEIDLPIGLAEREQSGNYSWSLDESAAPVAFAYWIAVAAGGWPARPPEPHRCSDLVLVETLGVQRGEVSYGGGLGKESERITLSLRLRGRVVHVDQPAASDTTAGAQGTCR